MLLSLGCATGCTRLTPDTHDLAYPSTRAPKYAALGTLRYWWTRDLVGQNDGQFTPVEGASAFPVRGKNRVYIGSSARKLLALNATGNLQWEYQSKAAIHSQPVADDKRVYLGTDDGALHAIDPRSGKRLWRKQLSGSVRNQPVLYRDTVFVITAEDYVSALERETGKELWAFKRDLPEGFAIAGHAGLLLENGLLYCAFTDGTVVALDPVDGNERWLRDTTEEIADFSEEAEQYYDVDTTPTMADGSLFVGSISQGVFKLDPQNGSVRERWSNIKGVTDIVKASNNTLILASAEHGLLHVRTSDLSVIWSRETKDRGVYTSPVVHRGMVLVGESQGAFMGFDLLSGKETGRIETRHGISARAAVMGRVGFVISNGGDVFAFRM